MTDEKYFRLQWNFFSLNFSLKMSFLPIASLIIFRNKIMLKKFHLFLFFVPNESKIFALDKLDAGQCRFCQTKRPNEIIDRVLRIFVRFVFHFQETKLWSFVIINEFDWRTDSFSYCLMGKFAIVFLSVIHLIDSYENNRWEFSFFLNILLKDF